MVISGFFFFFALALSIFQSPFLGPLWKDLSTQQALYCKDASNLRSLGTNCDERVISQTAICQDLIIWSQNMSMTV